VVVIGPCVGKRAEAGLSLGDRRKRIQQVAGGSRQRLIKTLDAGDVLMVTRLDRQVRRLTKAGCKKVFREVASGAKTDRAQLRLRLPLWPFALLILPRKNGEASRAQNYLNKADE